MTRSLNDKTRGMLCCIASEILEGINARWKNSATRAVEIFVVPISVDLWAREYDEAAALLNEGLKP